MTHVGLMLTVSVIGITVVSVVVREPINPEISSRITVQVYGHLPITLFSMFRTLDTRVLNTALVTYVTLHIVMTVTTLEWKILPPETDVGPAPARTTTSVLASSTNTRTISITDSGPLLKDGCRLELVLRRVIIVTVLRKTYTVS